MVQRFCLLAVGVCSTAIFCYERWNSLSVGLHAGDVSPERFAVLSDVTYEAVDVVVVFLYVFLGLYPSIMWSPSCDHGLIGLYKRSATATLTFEQYHWFYISQIDLSFIIPPFCVEKNRLPLTWICSCC